MARNQAAAKLHFLTVREVLAASEGGHTDGGVFGAKLDDINAWIAEKTAQSAQMAGVAQEQRIALNTAQLKGTQVAHLAAGNVDLGTGSAARVLTSTDVLGNIDSYRLKQAGAFDANKTAWKGFGGSSADPWYG